MGSGGGGAYATHMYIDNNDRIDFWNYFNSAYQGRKITSRKLRDTHGFYHIVLRADSTSATASERMRIYILEKKKLLLIQIVHHHEIKLLKLVILEHTI